MVKSQSKSAKAPAANTEAATSAAQASAPAPATGADAGDGEQSGTSEVSGEAAKAPTEAVSGAAQAVAPAATADDAGAGEQQQAAVQTLAAPVPDTAGGEAIRAFLADWDADRPAETMTGTYGTNDRDRWAERTYETIPDGIVVAGGWNFFFQGGRFIQANLAGHGPAFFIPAGQLVPVDTPSA